ncbi:MAG: hypothetical protein IKY05_04715 [Bacteroidales bacterium]|nr:hypothetical protein [Bacteroidales bacterium]MBR4980792.1 hypothetical protein [Bacteroidales bacterium]
MKKIFRIACGVAMAALIISGCHKKDELKEYMDGNLNPEMVPYAVIGSSVAGKTGGITTPSSGVKYFWLDNLRTDTTWIGEGRYYYWPVPDSLGQFAVTEYATADGYYQDSYTSYITTIAPWLGGSLQGIPEPKDSIQDPRDEQWYYIAEIGNLVWFTENLNWYGSGSGYCKADDIGYVMGRLYTWKEATGGESGTGLGNGPQGACPEGWRVPTNEDWEDLAKTVTGEDHPFLGIWNNVGEYLTVDATFNGDKIWPYSIKTFHKNTVEFNALAGGMSLGKHSNFEGIMSHGYFWSATEKDSGKAYYRYLYYDLPDFPFADADKENVGFSVRCVKKK